MLIVLGCGRSATSAGVERAGDGRHLAFVAQKCPALLEGADALDSGARLFVEVAEVLTPGVPSPVGRWLDTHAVEVRSTAHLVAFPNVPTSAPWGPCDDAVCSSLPYSLSVTARLPERASQPIALDVRIARAENAAQDGTLVPGGSKPQRDTDERTKADAAARATSGDPGDGAATSGAEAGEPLLAAKLDVVQQEPALLPAAPRVTDGALVVTAYVLRRYDDLHRVLECKEQQRARAQDSHGPESSTPSEP